MGISEMLYEVVQGGQAMHSKTPEVLRSLLTYKQENQPYEINSSLVSEILFIKIVNGIDTSLFTPVFDTLFQTEDIDQELTMKILSNAIRLKFGKRLPLPIIH